MILGLSAMTQMQVAAIVLQIHRMSGQLAWTGLLSLLAPLFVYIGSYYSLLYVSIGLFIASAIRYVITMRVIQHSNAKVKMDGGGSIRYLLGLIIAYFIVMLIPYDSAVISLVSYFVILLILLPIIQPVARFEADIFKDTLKRSFPFSSFIVNRWY